MNPDAISEKLGLLLEKEYNRGLEDGTEWVLSLMDTFLNHSVIVGCEPLYIRAVEEIIEDIQNTIDET